MARPAIESPLNRQPLGRSRPVRYGIALALLAAAIAMTWLFRPHITPVIFIFFYPAVVVAAWLSGFVPAAILAVAAVVTADLLFMDPVGRLAISSASDLLVFAIFLAVAGAVSVLMHRIREAQAALETQAADLEAQAIELEQAMEHAQVAREEAEAARRRSEHERWRVSVLAETSRALSESRDYLGRLEALAQVVVRELAEFCIVDVLDEDGRVQRVALAARDADHYDRVSGLREFVPQLDMDTGVSRVLRTGEPEVLLEVPAAGSAGQRSYSEQLRAVGPHSLILMPMRSNDRLLGCISFIRTSDSAPFDHDDVELTRVLAIRAGVLIEMARLYRNALEEIERRRLIERELQEQAQQLEELNVEQEETMAALEEQTQQAQEAERAAHHASQAKSQFLAVMSHELRTPLNAIMGYTDLLQYGVANIELDETSQAFLERIRTSVLHLRGLIDEILSLARIEAGREEILPARCNVAAVVREVAAMMHPESVQKGLQLQVQIESDVIVTTDPGKLRQILLNLTSNAIKFTDRGAVTLSLRSRNEHVEIDVADTGVGIAPEHVDRIFELFTQVDQSRTRRVGGTGLGLAVSRRLARLLGGDLHVDSEPGRGSRFRVSVPLQVSSPTA